MIEEVKKLANRYFEDIVKIRRSIHQNPELSFEEHNTSLFIQHILEENNISFQSGIVKTGIVAEVKGELESSKHLVLRADMDALPILEKNETPYKSVNEGVMHACGHDVHSSSLLGTLLILNDLKHLFGGTIRFVFQPGEEKLPGGASLMIKEGVLEPKPTCCIAQHVYPELEAGKVGFKTGTYMASADEIHITIKGKGGHAALPHLLVDPVVISAQIITSLQQIVSRNNNPENPSVLSFGYIDAQGATNVIPDSVQLKGTFRTFDEKWRFEAHHKIKSIINSICDANGAECDIDLKVGYPYLKNDPKLTATSKESAIEYLGKENVVDLSLRMTSEDFSFFSQVAPSCFYRLGTGDGMTIKKLHTSTFDVNEDALRTSTGLMAYIVLKELNS